MRTADAEVSIGLEVSYVTLETVAFEWSDLLNYVVLVFLIHIAGWYCCLGAHFLNE